MRIFKKIRQRYRLRRAARLMMDSFKEMHPKSVRINLRFDSLVMSFTHDDVDLECPQSIAKVLREAAEIIESPKSYYSFDDSQRL